MQDLEIQDIVEWQLRTFPKSNAAAKLHHLMQEVKELTETVEQFDKTPDEFFKEEIALEFADCFILLFGSMYMVGFNQVDIDEAIRRKMAINKNRKWGTPDENGVVNHVKE